MRRARVGSRVVSRVALAALLALAGRAAVAQTALAAPAALPGPVEAISLLGDTLRRPPLAPDVQRRLEAQLDTAAARLAAAPGSVDEEIWVARRLGYLGRFREAVDSLTASIARHPRDPRLYRHRGHRYLTLRKLDSAAADLERAASLIRGRPDAVEPDGQPNARGVPVGTLHSNVWYHLALARYLQGDYVRGLAAARAGLRVSDHPDRLVSQTYWAYLLLRRVGNLAEARRVLVPIRPDLAVIENGSYHRLLLVFKGALPVDSLAGPLGSPSDLAVAYGLSAWHALEGRPAEAAAARRRILASGQWPSFGYLAAEADEARARGRVPGRR